MICEACRLRPGTVELTPAQGRVRVCATCAKRMQSGSTAFSRGPRLSHVIREPQGRMNVLSRLGDDARLVLEAAAERALDAHQAVMTPEMLLAAIITDDNLRDWVAESLGIDTEAVLAELTLPESSEGAGRAVASIRFGPQLKRVLQLADKTARAGDEGLITVSHLLAGVLAQGESLAAQVLRAAMGPAADETVRPRRAATGGGDGGISRLTHDLTKLAREGKLDPVVGREREIERVIRILSRRGKNNPVLLGEAGVGKTAIAHGLALRIASGNVPDALRHKQVLALDHPALFACTHSPADREARLNMLLATLQTGQTEAILFVDDLHLLTGIGTMEGMSDAGSILTRALQHGAVQTIGASNLCTYRRWIATVPALTRCFQPVLVSEPTIEQTVTILRTLGDRYEAHHTVAITDEAVTGAVTMADQFIPDHYLPDKALDILDDACALARLDHRQPPARLAALEAERHDLLQREKALIKAERFDEASSIKDQLATLAEEIARLEIAWRTETGQKVPTVSLQHVARVVSERTGIESDKLLTEERAHLMGIEAHLHRRVIGQDEAITAVSEAVRRVRTGLRQRQRALGSFVFLGPSGVGKTELVKAIAEYLFHDEAALISFDMQDFQDHTGVERLIGTSRAINRRNETGVLSDALRRRPYGVLVLEAIDAAHSDVLKVIIRMVGEGRLLDAQGREIDCRNLLVVMTSRIGAAAITELTNAQAAWPVIKKAALAALHQGMRPDFLDAVDDIVVFHPLQPAQVGTIVDGLLEATRRQLHAQGLVLELSDAARQAIAQRGFTPESGARLLRRTIARELENPIARLLLKAEFVTGDRLRVDVADDHFVFFRTERAGEVPAGPSAVPLYP